MMPIVFCASLPPCPSEYAAADTSCSLRKIRSTFTGVALRKTFSVITARSHARNIPIIGASTM
jgi:hypothetical protein